jgi:lantibiotic modifying enzyme
MRSTQALAVTEWLDEALSLEQRLLGQARRTPGDEVIWLAPPRGEGSRPAPLGWHLYDGVTGVALFLAALEHVEGTRERRTFILPALSPLRRYLKELVADPAGGAVLDLGGFRGLGGFLYGFLLIGRWIGEPELIAEAAGTAALLTPERIAADEALDVMGGCAGALAALLALDREVPEAVHGLTPLARAVACGERLLDRRAAPAGGPRAWPARGKAPRCGFAHGAAGIACCLARLFERTGDPRFLAAAEEGVAFEYLQYRPEQGNWPVPGSGLGFMTSWCNGAPGVALGRLGMLGLSAAGPVERDLRAALETTLAFSHPMGDSLCCGSLGRAEILLRAYEILGEERLLRAAEEIASRTVAGARPDEPVSPSFFKGTAGVGYGLLRLARPSLLPCVLALEAC